MEKLKSTLPNMLIVLTGICVIAGAILAAVNNMTAGPIAEAQALALEQAIKDVTPEFNNKPSEEAFMAVTPEGDSLKVYPAKMDGELVGVAVESINRNYKAFSGDIKVVVGFDVNGKILNYSVQQHSETPGLGAKMQDWFSDENKPKQNIKGRQMPEKGLSVSKDGGDVDAITAATITSRAFLDAVNRAYSAFMNTDATSSATSTNEEGGNDHE